MKSPLELGKRINTLWMVRLVLTTKVLMIFQVIMGTVGRVARPRCRISNSQTSISERLDKTLIKHSRLWANQIYHRYATLTNLVLIWPKERGIQVLRTLELLDL
jgi:hypothetical protein